MSDAASKVDDRLERAVVRVRAVVLGVLVSLPVLAVVTTSERWARGLSIAEWVVLMVLVSRASWDSAFGAWSANVQLPVISAATLAGVRRVDLTNLVEVRAIRVHVKLWQLNLFYRLRDAEGGSIAVEDATFPELIEPIAAAVETTGAFCDRTAAEGLGLVPRARWALRLLRMLWGAAVTLLRVIVLAVAVTWSVAAVRGVSLDSFIGS